MKSMWFVLLLLVNCPAGAAEDPIKIYSPFESTPTLKATAYSLRSGHCEVELHAVSDEGGKHLSMAYTGAHCPMDTNYDVRVGLYEKLISRIFESGFLAKEREVPFDWGPIYETPTLVCRMIRYASGSREWAALLKKFGDKPVLFKEGNPMPLDLGAFMRSAGLLQEVERIFLTHGYRLKSVGTRYFESGYVSKLSGIQRTCVAEEPIVGVVPTGVELFLLFERTDLPKVNE